eukprot:59938_1
MNAVLIGELRTNINAKNVELDAKNALVDQLTQQLYSIESERNKLSSAVVSYKKANKALKSDLVALRQRLARLGLHNTPAKSTSISTSNTPRTRSHFMFSKTPSKSTSSSQKPSRSFTFRTPSKSISTSESSSSQIQSRANPYATNANDTHTHPRANPSPANSNDAKATDTSMEENDKSTHTSNRNDKNVAKEPIDTDSDKQSNDKDDSDKQSNDKDDNAHGMNRYQILYRAKQLHAHMSRICDNNASIAGSVLIKILKASPILHAILHHYFEKSIVKKINKLLIDHRMSPDLRIRLMVAMRCGGMKHKSVQDFLNALQNERIVE